jgi:site-specific DNA recombinase
MADKAKLVRCAVYTRKSSEEGLEQSFNSLHAQREACEAYIVSQKHEGWQLWPKAYDDGGFSGGTMERPGLKQLLADVKGGLIDTIVVYKVDRLSRSLSDFAKMVDLFEADNVSFVSVTQAFNTTTSMGRLTLNMLLSFAQFEREVTGERIRDKIAASKAKGMWMGGNVPLGYDAQERLLVLNKAEAEQVRQLFGLYVKHKAVDAVVAKADHLSIRSKLRESAGGRCSGGAVLTRGSIYRILANPIYRSKAVRFGAADPGRQSA